MNELLEVVTQVLYILLSVIAIVDYFLHRNPRRRDFALMASALGLPLGITFLRKSYGVSLPLLDIIGAFALFLQPYFLFRLLQYFNPSPRWIRRLILPGAILSCVVLLVFTLVAPIVTYMVVFGYCSLVEGYATWGYLQGLKNTSGTLRRRLRLITISAGIFATVFVLIWIAPLLPAISISLGPVAQAAAAISAVLYYFAFVPPRWLRHVWQLEDVRDYLKQTQLPADGSPSVSFNQLSSAARLAANGIASGIVHKHVDSGEWTILSATDSAFVSKALLDGQAAVESAWQRTQPHYLEPSTITDADERQKMEALGARTWLFIPILGQERRWGLLLVFLRDRSLFIDDDLSLIELLAQQCAIVLENYRLIDELRAYSDQLEKKVEERTAALSESENRYRELNLELEQRVRERTAQLEAANRELESFSYSVSHDLRAPLRAVDGFSQVLEEEATERLTDIEKAHLKRIRANSQHMGQLIDDLLQLSHLTRGELKRESVDLSVLACQIEEELREQNPQREITLEVEDGMVVHGDPALLRVALTNLLSNAWKYTSRRPSARVTFGTMQQDGQRVFFVRDNGAGFDMAYAGRLFGVFQRLHGAKEFPGSGIGLATVQRIINRHGGQIWAEAAVEQGATFYFSL